MSACTTCSRKRSKRLRGKTKNKMENTTGLNELAVSVHADNQAKGFEFSSLQTGTVLMLIVGELSEAMEAARSGRQAQHEDVDLVHSLMMAGPLEDFREEFLARIKDTFQDEIADAVIRLLDLCGAMKIDIEKHIEMKLEYNRLRPFRHGKKF